MDDTNFKSPSNGVRKIVDAMRNSPSSIRICEAGKVLESCGYFPKLSKKRKGSHLIYTNGQGGLFPLASSGHKHLVKSCYIRDILNIYDENYNE